MFKYSQSILDETRRNRNDTRAIDPLRFRIIRHGILYPLLLTCLLAAAGGSPPVNAQPSAAAPSRQYFVRQQANETLLIRINAYEAEFEARVYGPERTLLLVSTLPGNRIAPIYQFIEASGTPRQLDIDVVASRKTVNSKFDIEFTRLKDWDDRSRLLIRAYRLLSYAQQAAVGDNSHDWTIKVSSLISAAKIFAQFGMQEQRLWSSYLAAYLVYAHLNKFNFALELNDQILADTRPSRWQQIRLAALQLKANILAKLEKDAATRNQPRADDPVQSTLFSAAQLAASMGFRYQQAKAINSSGLDYANQLRYPQALVQFERALKLTKPLGDNLFLKNIRENIVAINAHQGNAPASGQILQDIQTQLLKEGAGDELAKNLLQQGNLLLRSHRYREASKALSQALQQQNDSSLASQANFALAKASFERGEFEESLGYLNAAGISQAADMIIALRIRAGIYRSQGEFGQMRQARTAQRKYVHSDAGLADYLYQRGLDALAQGSHQDLQAAGFFRRSYQLAITAGLTDAELLSQLQLCALEAADTGLCSTAKVQSAVQQIRFRSAPRQVLEANYLQARFLLRHGRRSAARTAMADLVSQIQFYRQVLEGVLGAWYWQRHNDIFNDYLDLAATATSVQSPDPDRAFDSLLALSKIRFATKPPARESHIDAGPAAASLRKRIAQLENATTSMPPADLLAGIRHSIDVLRKSFARNFRFLSRTGLQNYLDSMPAQAVLLTYHIAPDEAFGWVAKNGTVQRFIIDHPGRVYSTLQTARSSLGIMHGAAFDTVMQSLGKDLLGPITGGLPKMIFFVPAGLLTGFPLDALRLKQSYLIEHHQLTNLLDFPARSMPVSSLKPFQPTHVFLAGYPQDYSSVLENRLVTSTEISAVADLFIGPGLQIVQGGALLKDEFMDQRFRQADLIHLSMPGLIDLSHRQRSGLELSAAGPGTGREFLKLTDIDADHLQARLVFLSRTRLNGESEDPFGTHAGLVSEFLERGATAVIASSWRPTLNPDSLPFTHEITSFYRLLAESNDRASALAGAKREHLRLNRSQNTTDWATLQMYIK